MPERLLVPSTFTSSAIAATGNKFAWLGRHWNAARATKSIRRVQFLFGTVTKAGGSAMTLSLQDVDAAATILAPDGTQDQTVAIANADASFVSNTWYRSGALSADRSVAFGALVACVIEYDGGGRLGADTVSLNNINAGLDVASGVALNTGSWALVGASANIVFEYDDGTFGTLEGAIIASAFTSQSFANGSTPDEYALKFQVPFDCTVDQLHVLGGTGAATRDYSVILNDGTTDLVTVTVDASTLNTTGAKNGTFSITPTALSKNTNYYVSFRPDQAANDNVTLLTVNDANHFTCMPGGTSWHLATRTNAGAWTATTTQRPWFGIGISKVDDGTGAGAGGGHVASRQVLGT